METNRNSLRAILLLILILALQNPLKSEILWSENFNDGNFTANPPWNVPWGEVAVVPFGGGHVLDVHALPMGMSGRIHAELPLVGLGGMNEFTLDFYLHPRETLTSANNVRIQVYDWETYETVELMENDNSNLQIRVNGSTVSQVPINGFPARWHHVLIHSDATGSWSVIWDVGGSNQTLIQSPGPGPWGGGTIPYLQLWCDGHYNAVNGAYFDNFQMRDGSGTLVWQDDFQDGNYTVNPPWNAPSGQVDIAQLEGNYVLDNRALPNWTSGRIYAPWPVSAVTGLNTFRLEFCVRPRETLTIHNNVRMQIFNWNSSSYFELIENNNNELQLRFDGQIVTQTPLNGFPDRWHHVIMERNFPGGWTVVWDAGGPNQTTLTGQDNWGNSTIPFLTLQCDGYYSAVNGAYFDNFVMSTPPYTIPGEFVVDAHTAGLWHFNENSGLIAHDATNNHFDMALQDGAGWHVPGWNNTPASSDMTDPDAKLNSSHTVGNGFNAVTLEAWIYPTQIGPYTGWFCDHPIITRQEFHNVSDCSFYLILTAKGEIYAGVNLNQPGGPVSQALSDSGLIQINQWYHVAATWSSGQPLRIFINDMTTPVEVSPQSPVGTIRVGTDALRIGCNWTIQYYNLWEYFQGYIDEARISAVDRYPVTSFPGEFVVDEHTEALWHFNENSGTIAHDATEHDYDMALQDGAGWHAPGWNNTPSAADMTDPNSKINSIYLIGNGWDEMTIDAHVYLTAFNQDENPVVERYQYYASNPAYYLTIFPGGEIYAGVYQANGGYTSLTTPPIISLNVWYHIQMTWTSGGHLKIFVNGSLAHAVPSAVGAIRNSTHPLTIGWFHDTGYGNFYMNGFIDEVRISDIDRSQGSPPGSPVQITLIPLSLSIMIPPGGGSFSFHAIMDNNTNIPQTFDLWSVIQTPPGYQFTAFGPLSVNLPPGGNITRLRTQTVPGNAPSGQYVYRGFVGDHPWTVTDADSFPFSKQGDLDIWLGPEGWTQYGEPFPGEVVVARHAVPLQAALVGFSPNPFNASTTLGYKLQAASKVGLKVYDTAGRLVSILVDGWREAGTHEVTFDGSGLASGVYLTKLELLPGSGATPTMIVQKLVLMK